MFFHQTAESVGLHVGDCVDAAFFVQINEFRDRRSIQLLLSDIRRHDAAQAAQIVSGVYPAEPAELPRSVFETLWRALAARGGSFSAPLDRFGMGLCPVLEESTLCLCLKVFEDLGLLRLKLDGGYLTAERIPNAEADLESSALLARLRRGDV